MQPSDNPNPTRLVAKNVTPSQFPDTAAHGPSLTLADVSYAVFRHKWKIILCSVAGMLAAGVLYLTRQPDYESEAKLFIRYVVTEGKTPSPMKDDMQMRSPDRGGETIMISEAEILTSLDLSEQVAKTITPEKILAKAGGGKELARAAAMIQRNLFVEIPRASSVIQITFKHPDPEIVQPVLREILNQYLKMHVEIHRAVGIVGDFLTQETDQLRSRLAQTEEELRKARNKAGVISVEDSKKASAEQEGRIRQQIFDAQAELAERTAVLQEITKRMPSAAAPTTGAESPIPPAQIDAYRAVLTRWEMLRRREEELLTQFTPENARVKEVRALVTVVENQKKKLEEQNPRLTRIAQAVTTSAGGRTGSEDPAAEADRIVALQSKIKVLNTQLDQVRAEASTVDQAEGSISELRRRKELEEANYRYYSASLEQSRIDEALGNGRVSNISQIQAPSPPYRDWDKTRKLMVGIAVGGIAAGLGWAFLIELYIDRTIRRPRDFERAVHIPLFLSIPELSGNGRRWPFGRAATDRLALPVGRVAANEVGRVIPNAPPSDSEVGRVAPNAPKSESGGLGTVRPTPESDPSSPPPDRVELIPWDAAQALDPYYSTLRDRLIGYFENQGLTHKPKLVAVTGLSREAGVSTIASGLAKCFSETGEGNVLLVDMTQGQGAAQQFFKGEAVHGLDEVLEAKAGARVQDNLYVVTEASNSEKLSRVLPKRFTQLVPKLKASDFDYIIFDMPAVSQISITPRLAGFMDMVLMVIESEKTDREIVQRATDLLAESKAHVGAVLNRTRSYGPSRQHEFDGLQ